jgi:hypothetical protein
MQTRKYVAGTIVAGRRDVHFDYDGRVRVYKDVSQASWQRVLFLWKSSQKPSNHQFARPDKVQAFGGYLK